MNRLLTFIENNVGFSVFVALLLGFLIEDVISVIGNALHTCK